MTLQGMSDQTFETILNEVSEIQFLIVKAGKMATKSKVEDILMKRHGLDRGDAHTFTNCTENLNIRDFRFRDIGIVWTAKRPEPTLDKFPEINL